MTTNGTRQSTSVGGVLVSPPAARVSRLALAFEAPSLRVPFRPGIDHVNPTL